MASSRNAELRGPLDGRFSDFHEKQYIVGRGLRGLLGMHLADGTNASVGARGQTGQVFCDLV
jgi:hypothetical protein